MELITVLARKLAFADAQARGATGQAKNSRFRSRPRGPPGRSVRAYDNLAALDHYRADWHSVGDRHDRQLTSRGLVRTAAWSMHTP
jgi:hypothetical protein